MWCSWSIPERCFDQAPSWGAHGSSVWGTVSETQLDGLWMEKNIKSVMVFLMVIILVHYGLLMLHDGLFMVSLLWFMADSKIYPLWCALGNGKSPELNGGFKANIWENHRSKCWIFECQAMFDCGWVYGLIHVDTW